jgi:archaellum component FlaC
MKVNERYLEEFDASLQRIEEALYEKLDRDELEYQLSEIVLGITSKLEEIHDDVRELYGEVEDVRIDMEDLAGSD